jgi:carbon starvation protein
MSDRALSNPELPKRAVSWLIWTGITVLGAFALAGIALNRNEPVSAAWLVTAAICVYLIAYRFYSKFIAEKVLRLDEARMTPAERHNDGLDYVPTNKYVVFGHHFAAIAGAGPLVGPVLAAQMGYLPGTLWILVGVVFAGAVQDFVILFCSMRRDGRSLGEMVKMEMGPIAGGVALEQVALPGSPAVRGPLDRAQFQRMLPGGPSLKKLTALVRNYAGDEHLWDLRLILDEQKMFRRISHLPQAPAF